MATETILTEIEVEKILKSIFEERNIKKPLIQIEPGNNKDDGYSSFLTKVGVTSQGNNEKLHFIIKKAPKDEQMRKSWLIKSTLREIYFYNNVVTGFNKFVKNRGVSEVFVNVPKCFKTSEEEGNEWLVLEDIKTKNYTMRNRDPRMNEEHISIVFRQYAKFHAVSYAMKKFDAIKFKTITNKLEPLIYDDILIKNARKLCAMSFKEEIDKTLFGSVQKYLNDLKDLLHDMKQKKSPHSVILHGDGWNNNVIFNNEKCNSVPVDACFLDFHLCFFGSPVIDLCSFYQASAGQSILNNYKHHLNIYHEELVKQYEKFGGKAAELPLFHELLKEWSKYARYGFTTAMFIFRAMMCDQNQDEALDFNDSVARNMPLIGLFIDRDMKINTISEIMTRNLGKYMYDNGLF